MHAAWVKSVLLQVILWSYPFVNDGEFWRARAESTLDTDECSQQLGGAPPNLSS